MKNKILILSLLMAISFISCNSNSSSDSNSNSEVNEGAPPVPSNLTVTATSSNSISLSWDGTLSILGYRIYRSEDNATYAQLTTTFNEVTDTGITYTDTGLTPGTTYFYRVSAFNNIGESNKCIPVSIATIPNSANLSLESATVDSISISWNSVTGTAGYRVYRSSDNTIYTQVGSDITTGINYTDTGLTAGTIYYYEVSSYNSGGESARSNSISGITIPNAPDGIIVGSESLNSLTISWNSVTGAAGYRVYRSGDNITYTKTGDDITSGTNSIDINLAMGTKYFYKITAYNSGGESAFSSSAIGTTLSLCTVTYYGNGNSGGSVPARPVQYTTGDTVTVLGNTGYLYTDNTQDGITLAFDRWNTQSDGKGTFYTAGDTFTMGTSDVRLYAAWSVIKGTGPAGGIVFYDRGSYLNGWRYMEAAPASTEWSGKQWGCYKTLIGTGTAIGTGMANTAAIATWLDNNTDDTNGDVTNKADRAAYLCYTLEYGGYKDWFLPSWGELAQMTHIIEAGGFTAGYYWGSSEYDASTARDQYLTSGSQSWNYKYRTYRVRAIRAF